MVGAPLSFLGLHCALWRGGSSGWRHGSGWCGVADEDDMIYVGIHPGR